MRIRSPPYWVARVAFLYILVTLGLSGFFEAHLPGEISPEVLIKGARRALTPPSTRDATGQSEN
jgi:hypothetical protein